MPRLIKIILAMVLLILPVTAILSPVQAAPAGITVAPTSGLITTEPGGTATFTVVLNSQPTANVTISISSSDTNEMTVSPAALTFNSGNWNMPQTVTCTGVDDALADGDKPATAVLSAANSADPGYNGLDPDDVSVTNRDNEPPGLSVNDVASNEGDSGTTTFTFTVSLSSPAPPGGVTFDIATTDGTATVPGDYTAKSLVGQTIAAGSSSYTFAVLVNGDTTAETNETFFVNVTNATGATINDGQGQGTITNDDAADLTVSKTHAGNFYQGQTGVTYTITVTNGGSAHTSGVVMLVDTLPAGLTATGLGGIGWTCTLATLTATRADFLNPGSSYEPIILTVDVASNAPASLTNIATVSGGGELATANDSASDTTVIDQIGFTITPLSLSVSEGGAAATFTVKLNTPPTGDVTIPVSSGDLTEMTVSPASLTFSNLNWNTAQTVTITPVDDNVVDGDQNVTAVLSSAASADANYNGMDPADVTVTVHDNDNSGSVGGDGSSPSPVHSTTGQASVYPSQGGTISLGSGVILNIPAHALSGSSSIPVKIEKDEPVPALPGGFIINGNAYRFTVNGQEHYQFNQPVTITFTFDPAQVPAGETPVVYYYDDSTSQWVKLEGVMSGNTITVTIDHFTTYVVLVKEEAKPAKVKPSFTDISSSWAKEAIEKMAALEAAAGYPDGSFRPDAPISRAEFLTMLVKALNLQAQGSGAEFSDTANHWAKGYIEIASSLGISGGFSDGRFQPDAPITREQMAIMAVKAAHLTPVYGETGFNDREQISSWAQSAVKTAVNANLMKGSPDNNFRPQDNASRAEAVMVIFNIVK